MGEDQHEYLSSARLSGVVSEVFAITGVVKAFSNTVFANTVFAVAFRNTALLAYLGNTPSPAFAIIVLASFI